MIIYIVHSQRFRVFGLLWTPRNTGFGPQQADQCKCVSSMYESRDAMVSNPKTSKNAFNWVWLKFLPRILIKLYCLFFRINYCNVSQLHPFAEYLNHSLPRLRHLSMMGNPAAPSFVNGGKFHDYIMYR